MRCASAILLMSLASCTHVSPEENATSLFLGEWHEALNYREPPGCDDPNVICLDSWADVDFEDVYTLSGPRLPKILVATVGFHAEPQHNLTVLAATRIDARGERIAWRLDIVLPAESEACFRADDVKRLHIVIPKSAAHRGDLYCISVI